MHALALTNDNDLAFAILDTEPNDTHFIASVVAANPITDYLRPLPIGE